MRLCARCDKPLEAGTEQITYCSPRCAVIHATRPPTGRANNRYNGGLCFNKRQGRWTICCRDGSLVLYARGVMAAEIGRLLRPDEIVHHRNGDTADDRPENLQIVTRAQHIGMHRADLLAGKAAKAA